MDELGGGAGSMHVCVGRRGLGARQRTAHDAVGEGRFAGTGVARVSAAADGARRSGSNLNGLWDYAIRPAADGQPATVGRRDPGAVCGRVGAQRRDEAGSAGGAAVVSPHVSGAVSWPTDSGCCCTSAPSIGSAPCGSTASRSASTRAATIRSRSTSPTRCKPDENELVVAVWDPTDTGYQPRGKQVLKPGGIMYTAVTGIWQTVWLEPVPSGHIESLKIVPDVDRGVVRVTVRAAAASREGDVWVKAHDGQAIVVEKTGRAGEAIEVPVPNAELWSPDRPRLYDLQVELLDRGKVVDSVGSYFGMRKIEVKKDDGRDQSAVAQQRGAVSIRAA